MLFFILIGLYILFNFMKFICQLTKDKVNQVITDDVKWNRQEEDNIIKREWDNLKTLNNLHMLLALVRNAF